MADPNWLLGVGLQRGWNSAFDAVFYADNCYNTKTFNGKPPNKDEPIEEEIEWSEHLDNMMNLMEKLANFSRESKLSDEMDTGMLDAKGPVVVQIRRFLKARNVEAPVPQYLPPVEPWTRYKEFDLAVRKNYKGKDLFDNVHPLTTRELAIFEHNSRYVDKGALIKKKVTRPTASMLTWPKRFECSAFWGMMKLLEIDGKPAPGEKPIPGGGKKSSSSKTSKASKPEPEEEEEEEPSTPAPAEAPPPTPDANEVKRKAEKKKNRLRDSIVMAAMAGPAPEGVKDRSGIDSLIFQAAGKGKARQKKDASWMKNNQSDDDDVAPVSPRKFTKSTPKVAALSEKDLDAINNLSTHLSKAPQVVAGFSGANDPMYEVRMVTMSHEKEALMAKLAYAEKEVLKCKAEQNAIRAKMIYAEKEVELIESTIAAYEKAEKKMKSMA